MAHETTKDQTSRRRLWVVTELYYPEETSTGYYMTRIAEGLAGDFDVKALCGQPNYSSRGTKAPKHEIRNGVEISRAAGTTLNKNVILFRLINMITLGISTFFKALIKFRAGDSVLVVTTPPSMPFVIAIASMMRGAQYTLLIHDNYPEILIAVGKARPGSMLVNVIDYFNRWLYKHAAKIIAVGRDMHKMLSRKTAGLDVPIVVIQNWAELETVRPMPRAENALLAELGLAEKFVFLYAGNMGHPNDLETIVECAERLSDRGDIAFVFLGSGVKENWLRSTVKSRRLENVTILSPKPRAEQITFLNACDVGLVSLVAQMQGVSMPSRTYNILAAGKPLLALTEPESELAIVIDEANAGWHVPPSDPDKLYDAIVSIVAQRSTLGECGTRARRSALEEYSLEVALEKYRAAL